MTSSPSWGATVEPVRAAEAPPQPAGVPRAADTPRVEDRSAPEAGSPSAGLALAGLTLAGAEALAVQANPALAAAAEDVRAFAADARQSGLRPNPTLAFDVENVLGQGPYEDFDSAEITLAVAQLFELGGKRKHRRRVADAALDVAKIDEYLALREVMYETRISFAAMLGAQQQADLARESEVLVERVHASVTERVAAGAAARTEERRSQISLAGARINRMTAERGVAAASQRLAVLLGLASGPASVVGDLGAPAVPPALAELEALLSESPGLARLSLETDMRAAEVALARTRRTPSVLVGAGIRRFEAVDDEAFVLTIGLPLQVFDRGSNAIAAAESRQRAMHHRVDAAHRTLRVDLASAWWRLSGAAAEAELLEGDILTSADDVVGALTSAYREGKRSLVEVLDAQRARSAARGRYLDALLQHQIARIDVEYLLGAPLPE